MESSRQRLSSAQSLHWAGIALLFIAPGCASVESLTALVTEPSALAPPPACCQAAATWMNKVHYEPDPVNGGVPTPGIVGRVYLFGPEIKTPQAGDGSILVSLFDETAGTPTEKPIEVWFVDADTLQRLYREDRIGWGYTLFLPWSTYKREIRTVRMTVRFDPRNGGAPLFAPSSTLAIEHAAAPATQTAHAPALSAPAPPNSPALR